MKNYFFDYILGSSDEIEAYSCFKSVEKKMSKHGSQCFANKMLCARCCCKVYFIHKKMV